MSFHAGQYTAQQHAMVAAATATPKGNFNSPGLSNEIFGFFIMPNEANPLIKVHRFRRPYLPAEASA